MSESDAVQTRIARAIADRDDMALVAALRSGIHHGRPGVNAATKRWTARRIRERDGADVTLLREDALERRDGV